MGGFTSDLDVASGGSPEVEGLNKEPMINTGNLDYLEVTLTGPTEREPQAKASKRSLS